MAEDPSDPPDGTNWARVDDSTGLILWFGSGGRPDEASLAARSAGSTVNHWPAGPADAMQLAVAGQNFGLLGLAPGPPVRTLPARQAFDLSPAALTRAEALRLTGDMASASNLREVVRGLVAVGGELAGLPGVVALGWEAAGTVMSPAYFRQVVCAWLSGGAFPGLGLVALSPHQSGLRSTGLTLFTGYEIAVAHSVTAAPAAAAKLAVRAMHGLVEAGCQPTDLAEWLGDSDLSCAWLPDGRLLSIERP